MCAFSMYQTEMLTRRIFFTANTVPKNRFSAAAAQVQSGVARTGKWWGHQHFDGGEPDVLLFAKGIASGYPFSGMVTKDHMWDGLPAGTMGKCLPATDELSWLHG